MTLKSVLVLVPTLFNQNKALLVAVLITRGVDGGFRPFVKDSQFVKKSLRFGADNSTFGHLTG